MQAGAAAEEAGHLQAEPLVQIWEDISSVIRTHSREVVRKRYWSTRQRNRKSGEPLLDEVGWDQRVQMALGRTRRARSKLDLFRTKRLW